ncbi:hypothetical protein [Vibrio sp. B1FLJ16]|uniref:hypothetical protein n=1 Tax=Vibrio sp. B1FLJ16 TaxID=2751178 RepID=UPI0015F4AEC3|nr:hypothetical protein [Vibrio sp. B1FLJ16]
MQFRQVKLRVADLFRLEFVVAKQGLQQEPFEDIDSAASNGTDPHQLLWTPS